MAPSSSFKNDWPQLLAIALFILLLAIGARFLEWPKWDNPSLLVGEERIMSTHDAYYWLAGAEGVGAAKDLPLAQLAGILARALGLPAATVGFFSPVVFGGLTGIIVLLWAWSLGAMEAGICAGALAAIFPGFFFRSRLGYFDTDCVTLLFPLLVSWMLFLRVEQALAPSSWPFLARLRSFAPQPRPRGAARPAWVDDALMLAAGLVARFCSAWHQDIGNFTKLSLALALLLVLLLGQREHKKKDLWALGFFSLSGTLGWTGLAVGLALLGVFYILRNERPGPLSRLANNPAPLWILLLSVAFFSGFMGPTWDHGVKLYEKYIKPTSANVTLPSPKSPDQSSLKTPPRDAHPTDPVLYPGLVKSVQEAQNLPVERLAEHAHPYSWVAWGGCAGLILLIAVRPAALLLAPLVLLWFASGALGLRMSMFGGPSLFLGLCVPLCWAVRALLNAKRWASGIMAAVFILGFMILAGPLVLLYPRLELTPVLSQAHAQALKRLREFTPIDSLIWTWWDWGYAATYFSRRESFADGGRNEGERLFPLGLVLTTQRPKQANQLIKYCSSLNAAPWETWNKQPAEEVEAYLASLAEKDIEARPGRKNYLVVSLEQLRVLPWISQYGNWSLKGHEGRRALVAKQDSKGIANIQQGSIFYPALEQQIRLSSIDRIEIAQDASGPGDATLQHHEYGRDYGPHLISMSALGESFLLDDLAYESLLVRLLLFDSNSEKIAPYFKLIHEHYPLVRVYEVL
jgi:dolichyl-diphosphooligosaccharide--protein glycosyltransferase